MTGKELFLTFLIPFAIFTLVNIVKTMLIFKIFPEKVDSNNNKMRTISLSILYVLCILANLVYLAYIYNIFLGKIFIFYVIACIVFIIFTIKISSKLLYNIFLDDILFGSLMWFCIFLITILVFGLVITDRHDVMTEENMISSSRDAKTLNISFEENSGLKNFTKIDISEYVNSDKEIFLIAHYDEEDIKNIKIPEILNVDDSESDLKFELILTSDNTNYLDIVIETKVYNLGIYKDDTKNLFEDITTVYELHIDKSYLPLYISN